MPESEPLQQKTFKSLLLKQLFIAISIGLIITIPIITIPAYLFFNSGIQEDINQVEEISYEAINTHLASGWQKHNIDEVYRDIRQAMPNASLFLQKAPEYWDEGDDKLVADSPLNITFVKLIEAVEKDERTVVDANIVTKTISAAIPIKFNNECLVCHASEVASGKVYAGALGGTLVMQVPMTVEIISTGSALTVFILFLIIFTVVAAFVTNYLVQDKLLAPLERLDSRVKRLRLSSHQRHIDWQRTPQNLIEIDHIDESISQHIDIIQQVYQRLDKLMLTEQETGLFHKDHFNQVLQYEVCRAERYKHPFSLIIVSLQHVRILNPTAKNLEADKPGYKYLMFGEILNNDTRSSDMSFRLEEKVFAIVAPQTGEEGAKTIQKDIYRRLISNELPISAESKAAQPEYEFSLKMGASVWDTETNNEATVILKAALQDMQTSEVYKGMYPPKLNQQ